MYICIYISSRTLCIAQSQNEDIFVHCFFFINCLFTSSLCSNWNSYNFLTVYKKTLYILVVFTFCLEHIWNFFPLHLMCCAWSLSQIRLFEAPADCSLPGTSVHGDSPSKNSGVLCPPPRDLPNPGVEARSPLLQTDALPSEPPGKPLMPTLNACFQFCPWCLTRENLKLYVTKSITIALIIYFCVILISHF